MLTCPICQRQLSKIDRQHLKSHGLTLEEYRERHGQDAPYGYSEELLAKKSGTNHPMSGKKRTESERKNISMGVKKMWESYEPSARQIEHAREMAVLANGKHVNAGRTHEERSVEHRNNLSLAMSTFHRSRKGSFWDMLGTTLSTWADFELPSSPKDRLTLKCRTCGSTTVVVYETLRRHGYLQTLCKTCHPPNVTTSKSEQELADFIRLELGLEISQNDKSALGSAGEIDVFIPSANIGVEFHGLYWHSSAVLKDRWRHRRKYEAGVERGIRMVQVFEDEWLLKKEVVKDRLRNILSTGGLVNLYARKLQVREMAFCDVRQFLDDVHLQGAARSSVNLALVDGDGKIESVMTFGRPRRAMNHSVAKTPNTMELVRYAVSPGKSIVGGAQKLMEHFRRSNPGVAVESWADLRWVDPHDNVYVRMGFVPVSESRLGYGYTNFQKRFHRYGFRKPVDCPAEVTEEAYWSEKGFYRVFDCGQMLYRLGPSSII